MIKVVDYMNIIEFEVCCLDNEVKKLLADGWQPFGALMKNDGFLCQTMVKFVEEITELKLTQEQIDIAAQVAERIDQRMKKNEGSDLSNHVSLIDMECKMCGEFNGRHRPNCKAYIHGR